MKILTGIPVPGRLTPGLAELVPRKNVAIPVRYQVLEKIQLPGRLAAQVTIVHGRRETVPT